MGAYLLAISIKDAYVGKNFCEEQCDWLVSSYCSLLGVISTVGGQVSLFAMTVLSFTRLLKFSRGMSITGPVKRISYISMLIIVFTVLGTSVITATIPLSSKLEDIFVNSLFLPDINFLNGFVNKNSLKYTMEAYYGLVKLDVSKLSRKNVRVLIHNMFKNDHGGITKKVLGFNGNDPVCLFKFFCNPNCVLMDGSWGKFYLFPHHIYFLLYSLHSFVGIVSQPKSRYIRCFRPKQKRPPSEKDINNNSNLIFCAGCRSFWSAFYTQVEYGMLCYR